MAGFIYPLGYGSLKKSDNKVVAIHNFCSREVGGKGGGSLREGEMCDFWFVRML